MRKVFYVLTLTFLFAQKINGQNLDQQVIGTAGDFVFAGNNTLSFTVGETVVQTLSTSYILTQGFQQSNLLVVTGENNFQTTFQTEVYPNPTQENLFIKLHSSFSSKETTIRMTDVVGRIVFEKDIHSFETEIINIPMKLFSAGTYLLSISDDNKNMSSYKIIKVQ